MNYIKEKTEPYHISFSHFLCHCITDSFLPIDIQPVLFVIYARFLYHYSITTLSLPYHYPITSNLIGRQASRLYTTVYKCIVNNINDKHSIPIPVNHSIFLCKNGYKIGKTGWFSLLGKVL